MFIKSSQYLLLLLFGFISIFTGFAAEATELTWNGFASFYGRKSLTGDVYDFSLDHDRTDFSNGTRIGLNLRADFEENWAFIAQLVAAQRSLGAVVSDPPAWSPEFDWAFLNYDPTNEINIRIGRQIFPGSLTAEYVDVGLVYPWRTLPLQFKTLALLKAFEGALVAYHLKWDNKNLGLQFFAGDGKPDREVSLNFVYQYNDLVGATMSVEGDGWRIQGTAAQFTFSGTSYVFSTPVTFQGPGPNKYVELGARYDKNKLLIYAETADAECGANNIVCYGRAYYGTLGYHLGNYLLHFTYAYGENNFNSGFVEMTSNTVGLNYQVSPVMVLKAEYLVEQGSQPSGITYLSAAGVARSVSLGVDVVF